MTYITISHDQYLAHHGVKGMKWGVRKARDVGKKRGTYFRYEKTNKSGVTQKKQTRIGKGTIKGLQKRGLIDKNGNVASGKEKAALSYIHKRRAVTAAAIVGATAAVATGGVFAAKHLSASITGLSSIKNAGRVGSAIGRTMKTGTKIGNLAQVGSKMNGPLGTYAHGLGAVSRQNRTLYRHYRNAAGKRLLIDAAGKVIGHY